MLAGQIRFCGLLTLHSNYFEQPTTGLMDEVLQRSGVVN